MVHVEGHVALTPGWTVRARCRSTPRSSTRASLDRRHHVGDRDAADVRGWSPRVPSRVWMNTPYSSAVCSRRLVSRHDTRRRCAVEHAHPGLVLPTSITRAQPVHVSRGHESPRSAPASGACGRRRRRPAAPRPCPRRRPRLAPSGRRTRGRSCSSFRHAPRSAPNPPDSQASIAQVERRRARPPRTTRRRGARPVTRRSEVAARASPGGTALLQIDADPTIACSTRPAIRRRPRAGCRRSCSRRRAGRSASGCAPSRRPRRERLRHGEPATKESCGRAGGHGGPEEHGREEALARGIPPGAGRGGRARPSGGAP